MNHSSFEFEDWGFSTYEDSWARQKEYVSQIIGNERAPTLIFTEHKPVLTLGANFHAENMLQPREEIERSGVQIIDTDRGGDVTYHGPGQLVAYPLFPLSWVGRDVHRWLRELEEVAITAIATYGLAGTRLAPHTGVWVGEKKICAVGVKIRRWVSMHGIAINCDVDLAAFNSIVPCGIQTHGVTSLSQETGTPVSVEAFKSTLGDAFAFQFPNSFRSVV